MTRSAAEKAEKARITALKARLNAQVAADAAQYHAMWCDPAGYRAYLRRILAKNIADMRAQRLAAIRRRDDLIAWLIQFEVWREENGRPIAYCRRAPSLELEDA